MGPALRFGGVHLMFGVPPEHMKHTVNLEAPQALLAANAEPEQFLEDLVQVQIGEPLLRFEADRIEAHLMVLTVPVPTTRRVSSDLAPGAAAGVAQEVEKLTCTLTPRPGP